MQPEKITRENEPIGLYFNPRTNQYMGALDENAANGFVRVGFELIAEGREAAEMSQSDIESTYAKKKGRTANVE